MISASSFRRSECSSPTRRTSEARSATVAALDHLRCARSARTVASRSSSSVIVGYSLTVSPVAGSTTAYILVTSLLRRTEATLTRAIRHLHTLACASVLAPELGCRPQVAVLAPRPFSLLILPTQVAEARTREGVLLDSPRARTSMEVTFRLPRRRRTEISPRLEDAPDRA